MFSYWNHARGRTSWMRYGSQGLDSAMISLPGKSWRSLKTRYCCRECGSRWAASMRMPSALYSLRANNCQHSPASQTEAHCSCQTLYQSQIITPTTHVTLSWRTDRIYYALGSRCITSACNWDPSPSLFKESEKTPWLG